MQDCIQITGPSHEVRPSHWGKEKLYTKNKATDKNVENDSEEDDGVDYALRRGKLDD